jgi:outer membrane protein assembly factor BamB
MITSVSASYTQNVGQPQNAGQSQNIGQPTSSSSGAGGLADSPWPMFSYNAQRTGLSPYNTGVNTGQLKWSFKTDGSVRSPIIGSDGTIYVA